MTCLILLNCKKDVLLSTKNIEALPWWFRDKESACSAGDMGLIPGSGRSPGEGNGKPPLYFCLKNPVARGSWWFTVHQVIKESDMT